MQNTHPAVVSNDPNFSGLVGKKDVYVRYFNTLARAFDMVMQCYSVNQEGGGGFESGVIKNLLNHLLKTVRVLRLKYLYRPKNNQTMWVDITDSGFPNAMEIHNLQGDLLHSESSLKEVPQIELLKRRALDYIFREGDSSTDLLWQIAHRQYLEEVNVGGLFLPFSMGTDSENIIRIPDGDTDETIAYAIAWGSYHFRVNRPFIYILRFDQDRSEQPLEEKGPNHLRLIDVIQAEMARLSDLAVFAFNLDEAIESIHPKILKRIGLGPLFSPLLLEGQDMDIVGPHQAMLTTLLKKFGRAEDEDFMLFITDEMLISKRQERQRNFFAPGGRVREVFHIPEQTDDLEAYQRRVTIVHHNVILPHAVLQHIDGKIEKEVLDLGNHRKITYDNRGTLNGISGFVASDKTFGLGSVQDTIQQSSIKD